MTVLKEGDLQITIGDAINARKFDDADHGLSHCMKAVDFIVELLDCYLFIEIKDVQAHQTPEQSRNQFLRRIKSGQLDEDLKYKYRDSFLYEWASGRADKPIDYLVLIATDALDNALLLNRTEDLKRKLPLLGPQGRLWPRPPVRRCGVFNIASWSNRFPQYPIRRTTHPFR